METKWKAIATIGIWVGVGVGSIFVRDGFLGFMGVISTLVVWAG